MKESKEFMIKLPDIGYLKVSSNNEGEYPAAIVGYSVDGIEWTQDLCVVEQKADSDKIDIYVWSDGYDEDFSHKFSVDKYIEDGH